MDKAPFLQITIKIEVMNEAKVSKTHWKKLDNPNYLGAYSLQDGDNRELEVVIERVVVEKVKDGQGDACKIAYLENCKPMILNAVNSKAIENIVGSPYVEDWVGKTIRLHVVNIKAFGSFMDALRVKEPVAVKVLPELKPKTDAWVNCITALNNGFTIDQIKEKYTLSEANEADLLTQSI